jgi:hypothetical protein
VDGILIDNIWTLVSTCKQKKPGGSGRTDCLAAGKSREANAISCFLEGEGP